MLLPTAERLTTQTNWHSDYRRCRKISRLAFALCAVAAAKSENIAATGLFITLDGPAKHATAQGSFRETNPLLTRCSTKSSFAVERKPPLNHAMELTER